MEFKYNIKLEDNSESVLAIMKEVVHNILDQWGMLVESYAKKLAGRHVDTSRLINSITYVVDDAKKTVTIGTNAQSDSGKWPNGYNAQPSPYPIYVELGTGVYAENGDGRKEPWYWYDIKTKQWHFTRGVKPRPFLRPAVEDHVKELQEIAVEEGNREA